VIFFSPFGDWLRFFDVDHVSGLAQRCADSLWSLKPWPNFGKLGFFRRVLYARR
jgi:hypothetical protein